MIDPPQEIVVLFEYENRVKKSYYSISLPEYEIEYIELQGIHTLLEEIRNTDFFKDVMIYHHIPTFYGWEAEWCIDAPEFLKRAKLKEVV